VLFKLVLHTDEDIFDFKLLQTDCVHDQINKLKEINYKMEKVVENEVEELGKVSVEAMEKT
jgi:hypothetical protein